MNTVTPLKSLFPANSDMLSREEKWIQKWKENHVFEPFANPDISKFFLTVPYAYPTGPFHVGHGRTYTNGDVIARFHRIQGKNVWWPMGFHVTGTPVLAISDAIKRKDPDTMKLYKEYLAIYEKDEKKIEAILQSFEDPKKVAQYFSEHISEDLDKMGASIDWRSNFTTMDAEYQKFIQWQFRKLHEKKALVKGKYPILYSSTDKNAVGEDDIKDGDTDKVTIQEFELIKFPFETENTFLVASTLRPETLYGVTNIWINPTVEYVKLSVNGENWIIAKNAVEKIGQQAKTVKILETISPEALIHHSVNHPLESNHKIPILSTSFVSAEKGTGVVYSVPGHAPWDLAALLDAQKKDDREALLLNPKHIISTQGLPKLEELFVQNQNPTLQHKETLQQLTEEMYKKEFYEGTMNPNNGILSNMPVQKAKEKVIQVLDQQHKHDKLYEPSRRAFTRAGNPVSVAILEDQWFLDYSSKEWKEKTQNLLKRMEIYPEHFRKALSDALNWLEKRPCIRKRGLGTPFPLAEEWMIEPLSDSTIYMLFYIMIPHIRNAKMEAVQLDDAFFDSTILGKKLPENDSRSMLTQKIYQQIEYWYPNDWRHTAPAHISNHISFFLFTHTQLLEEKYWPKALTFNEMLVRNGVKMSKSKGNVIPLQHAVRDYGADLMRLFIVSSAGFDRVADWRDNQVPQVKKKMDELELTFRMAISSTNTQHSPETEWLVETLRVRLGETYTHYEKNEFMMAAQKAFFETLNEIKRFKKVFGTDETPAVKHVLNEWLILISPVTPFLGEEMWEMAHQKGFTEGYTVDMEGRKAFKNETSFVSTQTLKKPVGNPDPEMETRVQFIENVLLDIERVKKLVKGKQIKTGYVYSGDEKETNWLKLAQKQLSKYTQVEIKINDAHDPLGKKQKAQKGRPALYFE